MMAEIGSNGEQGLREGHSGHKILKVVLGLSRREREKGGDKVQASDC